MSQSKVKELTDKIQQLKDFCRKYKSEDKKSPADAKLEKQAGAGAHGTHGKVNVGDALKSIEAQIDQLKRDLDKAQKAAQ